MERRFIPVAPLRSRDRPNSCNATKKKKKKTCEDETPRSAVAGPRNSAQAHLVSGESGELQKLQYPRREEGERLPGKDEPVNLR